MRKEFEVEKLRGCDHYHTWKFAIENVLAIKGLSACITDLCTETDAGKKINCKAALSLSVETSLYVHIQNCRDALSVWQTLKNLFEDREKSGFSGA